MTQTTGDRNHAAPVFPISPADGASAFRFVAAALAPLREQALSVGGPGTSRKNVWITTACGQRFSINQIGSMFGRE